MSVILIRPYYGGDSFFRKSGAEVRIQHEEDAKKIHGNVIKWKHFSRYWPFVWGIHRSPVNYPHKGQWRGALMFSLIWAWTNGWVHNRDAGDLRRHRAHYDVSVMRSRTRKGFIGDKFQREKIGKFFNQSIAQFLFYCFDVFWVCSVTNSHISIL